METSQFAVELRKIEEKDNVVEMLCYASMEAHWLAGSCSSCPNPGLPTHIANLQQVSIQAPSRFTTQPQQPTNKNLHQSLCTFSLFL